MNTRVDEGDLVCQQPSAARSAESNCHRESGGQEAVGVRAATRRKEHPSAWLADGLLAVVLGLSAGCSFWKSAPVEPSHQLRSEASGSRPAGWDDRSRQIESNLGVR